jgi:hypothetical protein
MKTLRTFIVISRGIIVDKLVEKMKTRFRLNNILQNIVPYNVAKWCRARQDTDIIIGPMPIGCWMRKATDTHTRNMKYFLRFDGNNITFIRTLSLLLVSA